LQEEVFRLRNQVLHDEKEITSLRQQLSQGLVPINHQLERQERETRQHAKSIHEMDLVLAQGQIQGPHNNNNFREQYDLVLHEVNDLREQLAAKTEELSELRPLQEEVFRLRNQVLHDDKVLTSLQLQLSQGLMAKHQLERLERELAGRESDLVLAQGQIQALTLSLRHSQSHKDQSDNKFREQYDLVLYEVNDLREQLAAKTEELSELRPLQEEVFRLRNQVLHDEKEITSLRQQLSQVHPGSPARHVRFRDPLHEREIAISQRVLLDLRASIILQQEQAIVETLAVQAAVSKAIKELEQLHGDQRLLAFQVLFSEEKCARLELVTEAMLLVVGLFERR